MKIAGFDVFYNNIFLEKRKRARSARVSSYHVTRLRMNKHKIHDAVVSILWYEIKRTHFSYWKSHKF